MQTGGSQDPDGSWNVGSEKIKYDGHGDAQELSYMRRLGFDSELQNVADIKCFIPKPQTVEGFLVGDECSIIYASGTIRRGTVRDMSIIDDSFYVHTYGPLDLFSGYVLIDDEGDCLILA